MHVNYETNFLYHCIVKKWNLYFGNFYYLKIFTYRCIFLVPKNTLLKLYGEKYIFKLNISISFKEIKNHTGHFKSNLKGQNLSTLN